MPFESKTRIENLIPEYGKLKFANKEAKGREDEMAGFSENDVLVWRQLESQAHMANEQLEQTLNIFQKWLDDYEDVKDMVVVQKALNVMNTFGRLLLALDTERQFVLNILASYSKKIDKLEIPEKIVAKNIEKVIEVSQKQSSRSVTELEIFEKWQRGVPPKELAETYKKSVRKIQLIVAEFKEKMRKKDHANKKNEMITNEIVKKGGNEEKILNTK